MTTTNTNNTTDPYAFINGNKTSTTTQKSGDLDQNAFLKLMIAQLKNQDPTKPQDTTEFMSQLAQFSQVTSTQNMEKSIATLTDSMRSTQLLNGTSLVGHDILAPGSSDTTTTAGQSISGAVDAPKSITSIKINVKDASGALVRTITVDKPAEGLNSFTWDGKTNGGTDAPAGTYTFECAATAAGQSGSLDTMLNSRVSSVTIDPTSGSLTLNTSTGAVSFADVRSVL
jgi:flagellar basal-body rod modification protein FlgD